MEKSISCGLTRVSKNTRAGINNGDVATIESENNRNRLLWKLGRVEELIRGRVNNIPGARVPIANGNYIYRPLQKLFPSELFQGVDKMRLKLPTR